MVATGKERKGGRKRKRERRNTFSHFPREYCVRYAAGSDNLTAASLVTLSECRNNLDRACHRRRVALVSARRGRIRFHRAAVVAFPHRQISGWSALAHPHRPTIPSSPPPLLLPDPFSVNGKFCHRLCLTSARARAHGNQLFVSNLSGGDGHPRGIAKLARKCLAAFFSENAVRDGTRPTCLVA